MPTKDLYRGVKAIAFRTFSHPGFAALTTIVGVMAGLLGSLYHDEIKNAFLMPFWAGPFAPAATSFWAVVTFFGILFGTGEWARSSINLAQLNVLHEQTTLLTNQTRQIEQVIQRSQTLPELEFLVAYEEIIEDCYALSRSAAATPLAQRPEAAVEAGRAVLGRMVRLAQAFDPGCQYSANVMVFIPTRSLPDAELRSLKNELLFADSTVDLRELQGVLRVRKLLSTSSTVDGLEDPELAQFCLPVPIATPHNQSPEQGTNVLKGAPFAFFYRRFNVISDIGSMIEHCRMSGQFTRPIVESMLGYFDSGPGKAIKSFVSVPLYSPSQSVGRGNGSRSQPLGVLNIHSDRSGLLRGEAGAENFLPLIAPIRVALTELVARMEQLI